MKVYEKPYVKVYSIETPIVLSVLGVSGEGVIPPTNNINIDFDW